jgi:Ca2+-binding RTX toxin-like protein
MTLRPRPALQNILSTVVTILLVLHSADASAACPGPYAGKTCNGGTGSNICSFTSTTVTCSFNDIAGTQGADGTFFNTSNTAFRGFGTDAKGELFCCEYTGLTDACSAFATPIAESFTGTNDADTIRLHSTNYDLKCADVDVYGLSDNDDILGSRTLSLNYLEVLNGDDGADTIRGDAGTDEIHGGAGADIIWGGDDDDTIYGDAGDDQIKGDDGDDYLDGGADGDDVCGGANDDVIYGGTGNDYLFSGVGNVSVQTVTGGGGYDECGSSTYAAVSDCDAVISACPW